MNVGLLNKLDARLFITAHLFCFLRPQVSSPVTEKGKVARYVKLL